jgi:hypothetical protein
MKGQRKTKDRVLNSNEEWILTIVHAGGAVSLDPFNTARLQRLGLLAKSDARWRVTDEGAA